ncbi:hypothetical protein [Paenibacillus sp. YYML68]|uniref:hypothetical protein n=1 Tax=Paenibacillus sp. YYML68 TaxID=2909250 RepID=UPI0024901ED1|nr:hypothetical protein [Paenibacillus sp. YYML68]
MSGLSWTAIETEAVQCGRVVIDLIVRAESGIGESDDDRLGRISAALQRLIYSLDDSWKGSRTRPPATIPVDRAFYEAARAHHQEYDVMRLHSSGAADLFAATPVTQAVGRTFRLLDVTEDVAAVQQQLAAASTGAVLAYELWIKELMAVSVQVKLEWATPCGMKGSIRLSDRQLQGVFEWLTEVIVTEAAQKVKGSLTALNLDRRTFELVTQDGVVYNGTLSKSLRKLFEQEPPLLELPLKVEAVIGRRITYRPCIQVETVSDSLQELDTHIGLDVQETQLALQELLRRLEQFGEGEGDSGLVTSTVLSLAEYEELAGLMDALVSGPEAKGARAALDSSELLDAQYILAGSRPVSRLVQLCEELPPVSDEYVDEYEANASVQRQQRMSRDKLTRLVAEAYPDYMKLQRLVRSMVQALEAG